MTHITPINRRTCVLPLVSLTCRADSLAGAQPDGTRLIPERLTHQEIANRLGCSREMVSRLMKDLEGGGYIGESAPYYRLLKALPARW